jgi:hypothetical protein
MVDRALVVCRDPSSRLWQLGALPAEEGSVVLIGWKGGSPTFDGEDLHPCALAVVTALTQIARVTFPCSAFGTPRGGGWVPIDSRSVEIGVVERHSIVSSSVWSLLGRRSRITLASTRDDEFVSWMFDDAEYAWELQGQFAVLSGAADGPPAILSDFERLDCLFGDEWTKTSRALVPAGAAGVMRPGVDGDLIGVLSSTPQFEALLVESLCNAAVAAGRECAMVSETTFADVIGS